MATDPRVAQIDAALYRLSPPTTPYSTPFTYNNGLTVLEILERIRQAVIDTINYAEGFGKEVEGMVKTINETAERWATDSKKKLDDFESFLEDSRKTTDEKIAAMNTLIESFKTKLIESAFEKRGDKISAPLMAGDRVTLLTEEWGATAWQKIDDTKTEILNSLKNYYNKSESDERYVIDRHLTEGVVFGSSNATIEASRWTEQLCKDLGLNPHVYAIGGGGFTSTSDNNFVTQANNARNGMSDIEKQRTKYVFVIDLLNDIRAQNSISNSAPGFFSLVNQTFPNAEIKIIPVTYNESSLNNYVQMSRSAVTRTYEVTMASALYNAAVAEGSRSWLHFGSDQARVWDQGTDNVHMTQAGYDHIRHCVLRWMQGGSSWLNPPSVDLHTLNGEAAIHDYNYLTAQRDRDLVTISGSFRASDTASYDKKVCGLPGWARPYDSTWHTIVGNDRTYKALYVNKDGGIFVGDALTGNQTYNVCFSYRIF